MFSHLRALTSRLTSPLALQVGKVRWPSRCWICASWPSQALCADCVTAFAQPRHRNLPSHGLDGCHAALDYAYPWNRCITTFKFGGQPGRARALAHLMWHAPGIAPVLEAAELVVPMPLSLERLRTRGYNQSHELCRHLMAALRASPTRPRYDPHLLLRVRDRPAQSGLDARARDSNLRQSMQVLPPNAGEVTGRRVAVVDDIMTTGATLREAARALRQAGAQRVVGVVLAYTPAVS